MKGNVEERRKADAGETTDAGNVEERLKEYARQTAEAGSREMREAHLAETVCRAKERFYTAEQTRLLDWQEFLWIQLRYIRKVWWGLQFLLLSLLWGCLSYADGSREMQRLLGVSACVFVIFLIPEFWKSQSAQMMEIEEASYFSLRQIYSARMVLFVCADVLMVSAFGCAAAFGRKLAATDFLIDFLLPLAVCCCICFRLLNCRRWVEERAAAAACIFWCAVWTMVLLKEEIYAAVSRPVWLGILALSVIYLVAAVRRLLVTEGMERRMERWN